MKSAISLIIVGLGLTALPVAAQTSVTKADTPIVDLLNVGSSWVGGQVPGADQFALFDATMATELNNMNRIGGDMAVHGIRVSNPQVRNVSSGYSIAPSITPTPTFRYTGTLSLGGGGVDLKPTTAPPGITNWFFNIGCPIAVTADQNWDTGIGFDRRRWELVLAGSTFSSSDPRRTVPTDLGGHTVTKIGRGMLGVLFDRGFSNGTLIINDGTVEFANALNPTTNTNIQLDIDSSLDVEVNSRGTLQISQAPTDGIGGVAWEANVILRGGDLRLNGEEYTGNLTVGGELNVPSIRGQVYYENRADSPDPITITLASRLTGAGTLILLLRSEREQDRILLAGNDSTLSGAMTLWFGSRAYVTNTSGSATGTAKVSTLNGSVLAGNGMIAGPVEAEGRIWPGIVDGDTETLTTGDTTISGGLTIDIDGAANDRLDVSGTLTLDSTELELNFPGAGFTEAEYAIAEANSITGDGFASLPGGYAVAVVDGGPGQQLVVSAEPDPFAAWMTRFLRIDPNQTSPLEDADCDGLSNVVEFVLDGNPASPNRGAGPAIEVVGDVLRFEFTRRKDAQAGGYLSTVQHSTDLQVWTDIAASPVSEDDTTETLAATLPATARFARLLITLP